MFLLTEPFVSADVEYRRERALGQRRHRGHREVRRQAARAAAPRRVWPRRSAAPTVCTRASATAGVPS
jgi:hypothetical protein